MGSSWTSRRLGKNWISRLRAVLIAFCIGLCSVTQLAVSTPKGVQCPTAAVQTIRVAVRDCCNHVVGYTVRKPRPGEKQFKQCQCAEKRADQNHDAGSVSVFNFEALPGQGFDLVIPAWIPEGRVEHSPIVRLCAVPIPPATRPPLV